MDKLPTLQEEIAMIQKDNNKVCERIMESLNNIDKMIDRLPDKIQGDL